MSSVGQYSILSSPFFMRSVMKKLSDVDMFGTLRTRTFLVVLQEYVRLVVLVHNITMYTIVLCIQKVVGPAELRHEIIRSNKFSFSRAMGIELLLGGGGYDRTLSK